MSPICFLEIKDGSQSKGMVLVAAVGLMVLLGLFGMIGISVVSTSNSSHNTLIAGTQALAIAHAGAEWYLEQLESDADWTDEADQTHNFANGSFTISIQGASAGEVTFTSTATVPSNLTNVNTQRTLTLTAQRLPRAFLFALYQGMDPGANLQIRSQGGNHSTVTGDVWSRGSVQVNNNNTVTGTVYVPDTETVNGPGSYTAKQIAAPYPDMPVIDASAYTNVMAGYDVRLDANGSSADRTVTNADFDINTDPACVAGVCNFRNFTTRGTGGAVNITGNGFIIANRSIDLHDGNQVNATSILNITPDPGGTITFLANRDLYVGRNNDPVIHAAAGCRFYSRSLTNNNQMLRIRGQNTAVNNALIMARRRVLISDGSDITGNSTIYVDYPGNNNSNLLEVSGHAGVTSVDGTLISVSRRNNGIYLYNGGAAKTGAVVTGLIYARATATQGSCRIQDATIRGSVVCNCYNNDRIVNVSLTYNTSQFPDPLPEGFQNYVVKKPNSWDGL